MALFRSRNTQTGSQNISKNTTQRLPETSDEGGLLPAGVPEGQRVVVTISRQCGSGGAEIGRLLARRTGLQYLNHEIIDEVARRSGVAVEQVEQQDEQTSGPLGYMLEALTTSTPFTLEYSKLLQPRQRSPQPLSREIAYLHLTRRVILEMASAGDAVIIGRGSQFLLRGLPRILHVYVFAPLPRRIENVREHYNLTHAQAVEHIERRDSETENYLRHYYGSNGTQPELYHLLINTGLFSFESAAGLIAQALPFVQSH